MKTAVVIPTYKRPEKLDRCLHSIIGQSIGKNLSIYVYADNNDVETKEHAEKHWGQWGIKCFVQPKQSYVIGAWNRFTKEQWDDKWDAMMWCVDDVELYPNCIEEAVKCMKENFKDGDGVVGIKQVCPGREDYTFKWFGQVLLGRKFVARYPEQQVCCPAYQHFWQDEEMYEYACSLNKFVSCNTAVLKHYHPGFLPEEMDSTHPLVRGETFRRDKAVREERQRLGYIWGKNFNLIGEKK